MGEGSLPKYRVYYKKNLSTYLRSSQGTSFDYFIVCLERISVHPVVGDIQCSTNSTGHYWSDNAAYNSSCRHTYYYLLCVFQS